MAHSSAFVLVGCVAGTREEWATGRLGMSSRGRLSDISDLSQSTTAGICLPRQSELVGSRVAC